MPFGFAVAITAIVPVWLAPYVTNETMDQPATGNSAGHGTPAPSRPLSDNQNKIVPFAMTNIDRAELEEAYESFSLDLAESDEVPLEPAA